ncbi:MAG: hypothetical protein OXC82_03605 [Rhodobacteraceae bacterium]|nr:hypothetical protein [Paracoccaceae bacterium]MCY4249508.1 hypothetical protein [Paracoccaceae bacterium]
MSDGLSPGRTEDKTHGGNHGVFGFWITTAVRWAMSLWLTFPTMTPAITSNRREWLISLGHVS